MFAIYGRIHTNPTDLQMQDVVAYLLYKGFA